jgi:ubiquitin C-terminal hydrolase
MCAARALTVPAPAQAFKLGGAEFELAAVACHRSQHYIAYFFCHGAYFRADDADVRRVGAHVSLVKADMSSRGFTPRLLMYAARHV